MSRALRAIAIALLASLAVGFAVGTWIRLQAEAPSYYVVG